MNMPGFFLPILQQCAGALAWGAFFAAAPFEAVFGGCIVWLPPLIWRERIRASRYGFWPGAIVRFAVAALIVALAAAAPKFEDRLVGPIQCDEMPLYDLCRELSYRHGIPVRCYDDKTGERPLSFAVSEKMSRRAVVATLAKQAECDLQRFRGCANGSSVFTGVGGCYYLREKK